jgi:tetratricopeptide (TPR) repeat protein
MGHRCQWCGRYFSGSVWQIDNEGIFCSEKCCDEWEWEHGGKQDAQREAQEKARKASEAAARSQQAAIAAQARIAARQREDAEKEHYRPYIERRLGRPVKLDDIWLNKRTGEYVYKDELMAEINGALRNLETQMNFHFSKLSGQPVPWQWNAEKGRWEFRPQCMTSDGGICEWDWVSHPDDIEYLRKYAGGYNLDDIDWCDVSYDYTVGLIYNDVERDAIATQKWGEVFYCGWDHDKKAWHFQSVKANLFGNYAEHYLKPQDIPSVLAPKLRDDAGSGENKDGKQQEEKIETQKLSDQAFDYYKNKDFKKARDIYTRLIELESKAGSAWYDWRAKCHIALGEYDLAEKDVLKGIELSWEDDYDSPESNYETMEDLYRKTGKLERAIDMYSRHIEKFGDDVGAVIWVYHLRAKIYEELGNYDLAIADIKRAIEFAVKDEFTEDELEEYKADLKRMQKNAAAKSGVQNVVCAACGEPLPEGAKFCAACGAKVQPQKCVCSGCGAELQPGVKFCPECGTTAG